MQKEAKLRSRRVCEAYILTYHVKRKMSYLKEWGIWTNIKALLPNLCNEGEYNEEGVGERPL